MSNKIQKLKKQIEKEHSDYSIDWKLLSYKDPLWRVSVECKLCHNKRMLSISQIENITTCSCNKIIKLCKRKENKPDIETFIYFIYFPRQNVYKVGITKDIEVRFKKEKINIIFLKKCERRGDAFRKEKIILKLFNSYKYKGDNFLTNLGGITECFETNILSEIQYIENIINES